MTLEEMQEAKRQAEDQIQKALTDFMQKTGLAVPRVQFTLVELAELGRPRSYIPSEVRLDVRM